MDADPITLVLQRLPAGFPKLERLSVPLTRGNNPRIRLEAYTAITSNSFQIGGKLEVFASIGKFSIEGLLAVDALFQTGEPSVIFDLLANDLRPTSLYSLDDGELSDLLEADAPLAVETSRLGASIWITDGGQVGYAMDPAMAQSLA